MSVGERRYLLEWKFFGDLLLFIMIIAAPIIFTVANVNYLPEVEEEEIHDD